MNRRTVTEQENARVKDRAAAVVALSNDPEKLVARQKELHRKVLRTRGVVTPHQQATLDTIHARGAALAAQRKHHDAIAKRLLREALGVNIWLLECFKENDQDGAL